MALYLCVDCGGSKTSAAICDSSGRICGRALGGPSNFSYLGLEAFISAVRETVSNALKACPSSVHREVTLPPPANTFAAAWFGVSGVDSPSAVASITPYLSALLGIEPGPRLLIANDTHLLAAPLRLCKDVEYSVVCIAGTGSICMSFEETDGKLQEIGRVGGWGWMLGDEGGGFHIGREAIRQVLKDTDKISLGAVPPDVTTGKPTLKSRLLERFGVVDVLEILPVIHLPDPSASPTFGHGIPFHLFPKEKRLSSLSPIVFTSAFDDGDPLALNVLRTCAGMLASQIAALLRPAEDTDDDPPLPRTVKAQNSILCFGGSLIGVEAYRQMILDDLAQRGHIFRLIEFINDPAAVGAFGLAEAALTR